MKGFVVGLVTVLAISAAGYFIFAGRSITPSYAPKPSPASTLPPNQGIPTGGTVACSKDTKNTLKSIRTVTLPSFQGTVKGVKIELTSTCAFPVRNELVVLGIDKQEFIISGYPESGDTHTLIFTLMLEEFAKTKTGDQVSVYYGREGGEPGGQRWEFGRLDKTVLDKAKFPTTNPTKPQVRGSKKIETRVGTLTLLYQNGTTTLSGHLTRSTPCVDWQISKESIKNREEDLPVVVKFRISDRNKSATCIQVIGQSQFVTASSAAGEKATYRIILEDEEVSVGGITIGDE